MATILPSVTVNAMTNNGRPGGATTTPAPPFDQRRSYEWEQLRARGGEGLLSDGAGAGNLERQARPGGPAVGLERNVGVQHGDARIEVAVARCREERVDDFTLDALDT
jgi:hypothetical protein